MGGPTHDPDALAQFQNGETRLVYARHRKDQHAPAYYLQDGTAREVRGWAKEHLECFMPDCSDRRITTVARTGKRDGFSHYRGSGGHSREGLFHQQAKALIARWVTESADGLSAVVEQASDDRTRRADVMITWPDGSQAAVEVQYAPLTVDSWRERDQSYRSQGITPIWLLGHLPPHLRQEPTPGDTEDARIKLGVLHQAIAHAGMDVLWINPIEEKIATTWVIDHAHRCAHWACRCPADDEYGVRPREFSSWGYFAADPIADCQMTPAGLVTPSTRRLAESMAQFALARARDREEQQRRAEAASRRRAEQQRRDGADLAERDRRQAWLQERVQEHERRWLDSDLRRKVINRYGSVPHLLATDLRNGYGVFAHPEHWHTALYGDLILGKSPGSRFTIGDCYRTLRDNHDIAVHPSDPGKRARAVITFLDHLADHGLLRKRLRDGSTWRIDFYEVVCDIDAYQRRVAQEAAARRAAAEERAREDEQRRQQAEQARARAEAFRQERLRRVRAQFATSVRDDPQMTSTAQVPADSVRDTPSAKCNVCGRALDPLLAKHGRHVLC